MEQLHRVNHLVLGNLEVNSNMVFFLHVWGLSQSLLVRESTALSYPHRVYCIGDRSLIHKIQRLACSGNCSNDVLPDLNVLSWDWLYHLKTNITCRVNAAADCGKISEICMSTPQSVTVWKPQASRTNTIDNHLNPKLWLHIHTQDIWYLTYNAIQIVGVVLKTIPSVQHKNSHYWDKAVMRLSYFYNVNPKLERWSLYWNGLCLLWDWWLWSPSWVRGLQRCNLGPPSNAVCSRLISTWSNAWRRYWHPSHLAWCQKTGWGSLQPALVLRCSHRWKVHLPTALSCRAI